MKARVPDRTTVQEIKDFYQKWFDEAVESVRNDAIKLCMVTTMQSLDDVGLADSTIEKIYKKQQSYIKSICAKNVTWQEIADNLEEERGISFEWINELGGKDES